MERKPIQEYYRTQLETYGAQDPRALSWASRVTQQDRFQALMEIGDLTDCTVLDLGCGLGDFYEFLSQRSTLHYVGADVVPEFIALARKRFPEVTFQIGTLEEVTDVTPDYILASGMFSLTTPDGVDYTWQCIAQMWERARLGVGFNMLRADRHPSDETFQAFDLEEVERFCRTLTDRVEIRTDYLSYDFTVYLYK